MTPISMVSESTGVTAQTLRRWEMLGLIDSVRRRSSGQRLYTNDQIERIRVLSIAIASGATTRSLLLLSTDEIARRHQVSLSEGKQVSLWPMVLAAESGRTDVIKHELMTNYPHIMEALVALRKSEGLDGLFDAH